MIKLVEQKNENFLKGCFCCHLNIDKLTVFMSDFYSIKGLQAILLAILRTLLLVLTFLSVLSQCLCPHQGSFALSCQVVSPHSVYLQQVVHDSS